MNLADALRRGVSAGVVGLALVDRDGATIATAGALPDDAFVLTSSVLRQHQTPGLGRRLFRGDLVAGQIGGHVVRVGVIRRALFLCAVLSVDTAATRAAVDDLYLALSRQFEHETVMLPPEPDDGGAGSPPAELMLFKARLPN